MSIDKQDQEPEPQWYGKGRSKAFFGNWSVHFVAASIYVAFVLAPLFHWAITDASPDWLESPLGFLWAAIASMAFPTWIWLETRTFEAWVRRQPTEARLRERAYFKLMSDIGEAFGHRSWPYTQSQAFGPS